MIDLKKKIQAMDDPIRVGLRNGKFVWGNFM